MRGDITDYWLAIHRDYHLLRHRVHRLTTLLRIRVVKIRRDRLHQVIPRVVVLIALLVYLSGSEFISLDG